MPIADTGTPCFVIDNEALRREALRLHLTTDLAISHALGVSPSTLSRTLAGRLRPSADLLARMLHLFGKARYERIVHLETLSA
jgi:transcriptional regulator with XRE-family HTH domain